MTELVGLTQIIEARHRVASVIRPTVAEASEPLTPVAGRPVILKPEYRQRTGSFKIRGAYNHIAQLPAGQAVVAASAGNHAQGVALAASLTGRKATIFMPAGAALPKVEATRGYGARIRLEGEVVDESMALAKAFAAETGASYVPPFDDPDVIAGQATIGLELLEEAPTAEVIVVPVGGGGLISGIGAAIAQTLAAENPASAGAPGHRRPRIVGVEAAGAASLAAGLAAGRPVGLEQVSTMADGIAVGRCSELTLAHAAAFVDEMVTVDEEEISEAMLLALERAKGVVEPAGAAALAAIASGKVPGSGPVVAVLSGGNVDPLLLTKMIEHGLSAAGRYLTVRVVMGDRVGALAGLTGALADLGLNVLDVEHHRSRRDLAVSQVEVLVTVETRDRAHHDQVVASLRAAGYQVDVVG